MPSGGVLMNMRHRLVILVAISVLGSACGGGGGTKSASPTASGRGSTSSGEPSAPVTLTFWHGYTEVEADWLNPPLAERNARNPNITIKPLFVNNDKALQKLTV